MPEKNEDISVVARELDAKGVSKTYLSYIPSFVLSITFDFIALAIDALLLAHLLGSTALSVDTRIVPVYCWIMLVMNLFSGVHIYMSRIFAENDKHKINSVFTLAFYLVLLLTVITAVIALNTTAILCFFDSSLTQTDYLLRLGHRYLQGLVWGFFPMFAITSLDYMVRIDGSKYLPVVAGISYIVCNTVLDLWLIGKFRYFGAGIATSISYWVNFLIMSTHFLKKNNSYKLVKFKMTDVSIKDIFSLSCPKLAHHIAILLRVTCLTILGFRNFGAVFGTVNSIYVKTSDFLDILILGVVDASSPLIGIAYGRKDYKTLRKILHAMHRFALPSVGILCLSIFIFPQIFPLIMNVHTYDEAFIPTCKAVQMMAIDSAIYVIYYIYDRYYQQIGYEKFISVLEFCRSTLFVIPLYYLLSGYDNGNGYWWADIIKELIILAIVLALHFWQSRKLRKIYGKN